MTLFEFIKNQGSTLSVVELCEITCCKHDNTFRNWVVNKPELLKATILGADLIKSNKGK